MGSPAEIHRGILQQGNPLSDLTAKDPHAISFEGIEDEVIDYSVVEWDSTRNPRLWKYRLWSTPSRKSHCNRWFRRRTRKQYFANECDADGVDDQILEDRKDDLLVDLLMRRLF
jgi:hypothetical protein